MVACRCNPQTNEALRGYAESYAGTLLKLDRRRIAGAAV
jgi:hypothetical protein